MKNIIRNVGISLFILACWNPSYAMGQFFFFENPMVGEPAKDFTLKTLSGEENSLSQFRDGKTAIVFFWATWCPHCREQLRQLSKEKDALNKKEIKIALVNLEEKADVVRKYMERNKLDFDVFLDAKAAVAEQYEIMGVPTFYFIDNKGVVQAVEHFLPENYEEILKGKKLVSDTSL